MSPWLMETAREVTYFLEVRHLPKQVISELGQILQVDHSWKDIMGLVPGKPWVPGEKIMQGTDYPRKYTPEDIYLVADECIRDGRTGFEVLIEEWGTSGRIRPKVLDLFHLLQKAGLERAASHLELLVCGGKPISDSETSVASLTVLEAGSNAMCYSANAQPSPSEVCTQDPFSLNGRESNQFDGLQNTAVPFIPYSDILEAVATGQWVGKGAFGSVYKAELEVDGIKKTVAIKLLTSNEEINKPLLKKDRMFKTEVEILSKCVHKNIIELEGFSYRESELCLVYAYMINGNIYDRLACTGGSKPLPWRLRMSICRGAAEGIVFLHTEFKPPLVHRDIKSQNILLDQDFKPKLGDFGIVRTGGAGRSEATAVITTAAVGTQMYMAPEAFRGDVSVKMDTFSFGIVVLELLTGLPFYDEFRENDLLSHVEDFEGDKLLLLDERAGEWDKEIAQNMFDFTELCAKDKRERPNMVNALHRLNEILDNHLTS